MRLEGSSKTAALLAEPSARTLGVGDRMNSRSRLLVFSLICAALVAVVFALTHGRLLPHSDVDVAAAQPSPAPAVLTDVTLADAPRDAHTATRDAATDAIEADPARAPVPAPEHALTVRGRLVGPDGVGVPGETAAITSAYYLGADGQGRSLRGGSTLPFVVRTQSGPDGTFEFDAFAGPDGERITGFHCACRAEGRASITRWTNVPEGQHVVELGDLALLPGATIAGFVRDVAGLAVEGARVQVNVTAKNEVWTPHGESAKSDATGAFRLEHTPAGRVSLVASSTDSRDSERFEATLYAGEVREGIELLMPLYEDASAVSGTVLDIDGTPLPRAPLQWSAKTGSRGSSSGSGQAGEDGRFRFTAPAGAMFRVTASHPQGQARAVSRVDIPAGTHGIELRLTPQVTIPLRVRRPDGAFIAQFSYKIDVRLDTFVQGGMTVESSPASPGEAPIAVPAGPFVIEVSAAGFATERTSELDPETLPPSVDVVLRPLPVLRGRVVHGAAPVAGAHVRAHRELRRNESMTKDVFDLSVALCEPCTEVTTGADGSFALAVSGEGRWQVRAAADGDPSAISHAVEVASGIAPAEIHVDLGPRGAIAGRALDANGAPLTRRTIGASCGDGSPVTTVTGADGTYRIEPLAPGGWQVRELDPQRARMHQSSSTEGDDDAPPIAWDCRVTDGAVTTHDVVVTGP